jgi:hypothetical protein
MSVTINNETMDIGDAIKKGIIEVSGSGYFQNLYFINKTNEYVALTVNDYVIFSEIKKSVKMAEFSGNDLQRCITLLKDLNADPNMLQQDLWKSNKRYIDLAEYRATSDAKNLRKKNAISALARQLNQIQSLNYHEIANRPITDTYRFAFNEFLSLINNMGVKSIKYDSTKFGLTIDKKNKVCYIGADINGEQIKKIFHETQQSHFNTASRDFEQDRLIVEYERIRKDAVNHINVYSQSHQQEIYNSLESLKQRIEGFSDSIRSSIGHPDPIFARMMSIFNNFNNQFSDSIQTVPLNDNDIVRIREFNNGMFHIVLHSRNASVINLYDIDFTRQGGRININAPIQSDSQRDEKRKKLIMQLPKVTKGHIYSIKIIIS